MRVTDQIHALKIPFQVPVSPEVSVDRFAFVYLLFGEKIHLIDSGVAGAESAIYDYLHKQSRAAEEISTLILTHSHPDHIGAAGSIKSRTGCTVFAHGLEQTWIENTEQQFKDRPVPGFQSLVQGPVEVDTLLKGGETLDLEKGLSGQILHTPGHSKGSISIWFDQQKALFTADTLIFPGDLPIYEDISSCIKSIEQLQDIDNVEYLCSSWEPPIHGWAEISKRMAESIAYLERIHTAVLNNSHQGSRQDMMELCQKVVKELGLPPFAANPLVARAFASSLPAE